MWICLIRASITLSGLSSSYLSRRLASRGFCGTAVAGALDLTGYLGDELCSAVGGQSLGAQIVHYLSPCTNCSSKVRTTEAAPSSPRYSSNQSGSRSPYLDHQPGAFASWADASILARSFSSVTPYRVSKSATSRSLNLTRPCSMRLIFDRDA